MTAYILTFFLLSADQRILTPIKIRTPDAQACETLRATLAPVVAHAQCEPVKPRAAK